MLDATLRARIDKHLGEYPTKRAACIDALMIVQEHYRWVSDEHLREVAAMLEMSAEELDGVASFYNLIYRKPVGEHVILVCDSVSCWLTGYEAVLARLKERLGVDYGQTTEDGRYTLLPMCCLGDCDHAPVMMIGEELHRDLDPDRVDAVLAAHGGS